MSRIGNKYTPQRFVKLSDSRVVAVSCQSMDNGNAVIVFEDVTDQAKAHERIEQLAWTDELTLTDADRSLPSGTLQDAPTGSRFRVEG